jgi:hypothetical protein
MSDDFSPATSTSRSHNEAVEGISTPAYNDIHKDFSEVIAYGRPDEKTAIKCRNTPDNKKPSILNTESIANSFYFNFMDSNRQTNPQLTQRQFRQVASLTETKT